MKAQATAGKIMGSHLERVTSALAPGRKTENLSPDEWDFRSVREEELMTVLLYEYTRSSGPAREAIENWHAQLFDLDAFYTLENTSADKVRRAALDISRGLTHAQVIGQVYDLGVRRKTPEAADALLRGVRQAAFPLVLAGVDRMIAVRFSSLEKPWPELQRTCGRAGLELRLIAFPETSGGIVGDFGSPHLLEDLSDLVEFVPGLRSEHLLIDWSLPTAELVRAFRILAEERQRGIPRARLGAGRKATWERLKWLAALRLTHAGYNFDQARKLVDERIGRGGPGNPPPVLPLFGSKESWSKAVRKVRRELEGDFGRTIKTIFGALNR